MIIIGGRGSGKTMRAVKISAETGRYILVKSHTEANHIMEMARNLNLTIPYPITGGEILRRSSQNSSIRRDGIIVDNVVSVLEDILGVRIASATVETKHEESEMMHELKIYPEFFEAVVSGAKQFEIRKNDRNFENGDILHLREWTGENYTGRSYKVEITYITDYAQKAGYVVLGIKNSGEA